MRAICIRETAVPPTLAGQAQTVLVFVGICLLFVDSVSYI
jgi:hypothetical protein